MSRLSINIHFINENEIKKMKFSPTKTIGDVINEISTQANIDGGGYGLFQNGVKRKRWLSIDKTLESYSISSGSTLEFKKRNKTIKVNFPDNSSKTFQIDGNSKLSEVINLICEKLQLTNSEEFALKRENAPDGIWLNLESSLDEQGIGEKDILLFRKRFFSSDNYIDTSEPVHLHLLYSQCSEAIKSGELQCNEMEAIILASLQLQINFGDSISPSTKIDISEYLPKEFSKIKNIEKKVLKKQKFYSGLSQIDAKYEFVKVCRSLKYYGITFFEAVEKNGKKDKHVLIGIRRDGIIVLDRLANNNLLLQYKFSEIKRYSSSQDRVTFDFGDYFSEYITYYTDKADLIAGTIEGYINLLIKKRNNIKPYQVGKKKLNELLYHESFPFDLMQSKFDIFSHHEYKVAPLDIYSGSELCKQIAAIAQVIFEHMKIQENGLSEDEPKSEKTSFYSGRHRSYLLKCNIENDLEALSSAIQHRSMEKLDSIIKSMVYHIANMNSAVYNASALKDSHASKLHSNISKVTSVFIQLIHAISKVIDDDNPSDTEVYKMISRLSKSIKSLKKQIIPVMAYHTINTALVLSVQNLLRYITLFEIDADDNSLIESVKSIKTTLMQFSHMLNQFNQFIASRDIKKVFTKMIEEVKGKLEHIKSNNNLEVFKNNLEISILIAEEIEQTVHMISNERFTSPIDEMILLSVDIKKIISQLLNSNEFQPYEDYFYILLNYLKSFQRLQLAVQNSIDEKYMQTFKEIAQLIMAENDRFDKLIEDNSIKEVNHIYLENRLGLLRYCFSQILTFFGTQPIMKIMRNFFIESLIHFNSISCISFENRNLMYESNRKKIDREELKCRKRIIQYIKNFNSQSEKGMNEEIINNMYDYENIMFCFISTIRYSWLSKDNRNYFNIKRSIEGIENNLENIKCSCEYIEIAHNYDKAMRSIRKIGKDKALIEKEAATPQPELSVPNSISKNFYEVVNSIINCVEMIKQSPSIFIYNLRIMIRRGLSFTENFVTILKMTRNPDKVKKKASIFIRYYDLLRNSSISLLNVNISENDISYIRDSIVNLSRLIKYIYKIYSLEQKDNDDCKSIAGNLSDMLHSFYDLIENRIVVQPAQNKNVDIEEELDNFIRSLERIEVFYSMNYFERIRKEIINLSASCGELMLNLSRIIEDTDNSTVNITEIIKYTSGTLELISLYSSSTNLSTYMNEFILYLHKVKPIMFSYQDSNNHFIHILSVLSYDLRRLTLSKQVPSSTFLSILENCRFIHDHINKLISSPSKKTSHLLMEIYLKLKDIASIMVSRIVSNKVLSSYITVKNVLDSLSSISKSKKNELKRKLEYLYEQLEIMKECIYETDHVMKDKFLKYFKETEKKIVSIRDEGDKVMKLNISNNEDSTSDKVITYDQIKKGNEIMETVSSLHQKAKYCIDELDGLIKQFIPEYTIYEKSIHQTNILIASISKFISNKNDRLNNSVSFKRDIDESISKIISLEQYLFNYNNIEPISSCIKTIDVCIQLAHNKKLMEFHVKDNVSLNELCDQWIQFIEDNSPLFIPGNEFLNTFVNSVICASQVLDTNQIEILEHAKKCLSILEQKNNNESFYEDLIKHISLFKSLLNMANEINKEKENDSKLSENIESEKSKDKIETENGSSDIYVEDKKIKDDINAELGPSNNNKMNTNILSDVSMKVKSVIGSFLQEIKISDSDNQNDRNEEIRAQWSKKVEEISMMARISKLERKLEKAKMEFPMSPSENKNVDVV